MCGDVTMAEHVYQTLRKILAGKLTKTESEMEKYMLSLRVSTNKQIVTVNLPRERSDTKQLKAPDERRVSDFDTWNCAFEISESIEVGCHCVILGRETTPRKKKWEKIVPNCTQILKKNFIS